MFNSLFATQNEPSPSEFISMCNDEGITCINESTIFDRPHSYGEVFLDEIHLLPCGHEVVSDILFQHLKTSILTKIHSSILNEFSNMAIADQHNFEDIYNLSKDPLNIAYINYLTDIKFTISGSNGNNGCIIMNCNPFTLGHKSLIEYALKHVDKLFIFIVEENLSMFSFDERFELVKKGISDINTDKIYLLPSGTLISLRTFPRYFNRKGDTSAENDICNFAQNVAPIFNITVRFVGKEPFSPVTERYNR